MPPINANTAPEANGDGAEDSSRRLGWPDDASIDTKNPGGAIPDIPPCLDRRKPKGSWRDLLKIHPAAEMFPMMSDAELVELGENIKAHGLREAPVLWKENHASSELFLLDGRNRLDAMELIGGRQLAKSVGLRSAAVQERVIVGGDPLAFVVSANLHRRHLTAEQKREVIAALLKAMPEKSNKSIGDTVKSDDKTVASVRRRLEATSEIPKLDRTVGKDGKARTAKPKARSTTTLAAEKAEALNIALNERRKRDAKITADKYIKPAASPTDPTKTHRRDYEKLRSLWRANHELKSLWVSTDEKTRRRFIAWIDGGATPDDDEYES